ncbi:MAG: DnaJ domain-containing protein [Acidobacteria bacterium]|nr:DnaJ domain-containing protein [Acidobacteriota bacterium]
MNPFETLEIQPGASAEEIKAAYHRLAMKWHPDRYTGAEKQDAEIRFRALAEAFSTLKDPEKRASLVVNQAPTPAPAAPAGDQDPAQWFGLAKEAQEAGNLERALGMVQVALRGDPRKAEYHALYGELLASTGRDQRMAVKSLETALRIKPDDANAMIALAGLYQEQGLPTRAAKLLQGAKEIAPNHRYFRVQARKLQAAQSAPQGLGSQVKNLFQKILNRG